MSKWLCLELAGPGQACHQDARGASRTVLRTHLPAVCPQCAMGQNELQNIRRAVLTEAVRSVAMVIRVRVTWAWCGGGKLRLV